MNSNFGETHKIKAGLWPAMRARPKLLVCILLGAAVFVASSSVIRLATSTCILLGWNAGCTTYLLASWLSARQTSAGDIQKRAIHLSPGRNLILMSVVAGVLAVLFAVATQLSQAKDMHGLVRAAHLALSGLTVLSSWLFTQLAFAMHYAHDFYLERIHERADPLLFPGTTHPQYGDFFYFSSIIGTSGQTADVSFNGSSLRPIGTLHCIISYFFNATVLALSINVLASALV